MTLLYIWGLPNSGFTVLFNTLIDGFDVGSVRIVPTRILLGVLLLAVLLPLTRWFGRRLDQKWLTKTKMNKGGRDAAVTITGYIGFFIVLLLALSAAGVEMEKLALIAGALSVGIGFGLQNIVNNFVSGIILLFERPIKQGDWIVVGGTEGYVQKIRVRSTEIRTFDRAEVIVPNSELISTQVINWTLYNHFGRIRIPIGVSYDSDPEKVKEILLQTACNHPEVVVEDSTKMYPKPWVLFMRFGDSALEFELRCFVRNINNRPETISELNFAIHKNLRAHGIEIPYPQRDLHIRSWPGPLPAPTEED